MKEIPVELQDVLISTPDTLHGGIRFAGTRVFAYQLFDYILSGDSIESFLKDFPGVTRHQVDAVLGWERLRIREQLEPQV